MGVAVAVGVGVAVAVAVAVAVVRGGGPDDRLCILYILLNVNRFLVCPDRRSRLLKMITLLTKSDHFGMEKNEKMLTCFFSYPFSRFLISVYRLCNNSQTLPGVHEVIH